MKRITVILLLVSLCSLLLAYPVAAFSLGISPSSVSVDLEKGSTSTVDVQVLYSNGNVKVEPIGIPVSVSPAEFTVDSLAYHVTLTLLDVSASAGTYMGYLRFTKVSDDGVGLAVDVVVDVNITAIVSAPPVTVPAGGGGGGVYIPPSTTPVNDNDVVQPPALEPEPAVFPTPKPVVVVEPEPVLPSAPNIVPEPTVDPLPSTQLPISPAPFLPIVTDEPSTTEQSGMVSGVWPWVLIISALLIIGVIIWLTGRWWFVHKLRA